MKYITLIILIYFISTSVSAQVFFKQRVYGNEQREKNVSSTVEVESSTIMTTTKLNGISYSWMSNYTSEWKSKPIEFHKRKAKFYLKDEKKLITMAEGRKLMKEMGERKVVQAIDKSRLGTVGGRILQGIGYWGGFIGFSVAATSTGESNIASQGLAVLAISGGVWFGGRQLVILSRTPIKNRLAEYNSRLDDKTEKNFYQNIKPSSLTFKPVQISPFTPSLAPTLGFAWKL
ncbi:hypothetical protein V9L05_12030 [Bernardetia sp. Wsw4-3y2]|uniref:hypothetical protein n=1 Tax=Bernardetia sp. Wsw4-3y2 TaxID=3127471 RepID=UPI0030D58A0A